MLRARLKNFVDKIRRTTAESGVPARLAGLAVLCGIGAFVPLPGLNGQALSDFFRVDGGSSLLRLYNLIVGGAVARGAVLALGVMPLLSAKLYLYLAGKFSPKLAAMTQGESGQARLTKWTRGLTFGLAVVQSFGFARFVQSLPGVVANPGPQFVVQSMLLLTAGAMGITWLSEKFRSDPEFAVLEPETADGAPSLDAPLAQPSALLQLPAADAQAADFVRSREAVGVRRE